MKHYYTVSLRTWIPLLLFLAFAAIWAILAMQQLTTQRANTIRANLRYVTQDLRSLQREINHYLEDRFPLRAEQSLTARGVDPRYRKLVAMDPHAWVLYSLQFTDKNSQATSVLPRFAPEIFHHTRNLRRTSISYDPNSKLILAYIPINTGRYEPNPRIQYTGAIYAEYDLNTELADTWNAFRRSIVTLSTSILAGMFVIGAAFYYFANRPIQLLAKAAENIAQGRPPELLTIHGSGELANLGNAFTHMSSELAAREQQLKTSEKLYRTLVEDQTEAVLRIRPDGQIVFANKAFPTLLQLPEKDFSGQDLLNLVSTEESAALLNRVSHLTTPEPLLRYEQKADLATGTKHISWIFHGIFTSAGTLSEILVSGRDTTEERSITEWFRKVIEASPVALIISDASGQIRQANHHAEDTFGYHDGQLIGQTIESLIPQRFRSVHLQHRSEFAKRPEGRAMGLDRELFAIKKSGEEFPIEVALKPVSINKEELTIAAVVDISQRKQVERDRRLLEAQLRNQQKLESIGTLAGGVAHEINNPINGIMNYAQLITDRLEPDSPLREFGSEIILETERVATIVQNLLSFARQENESLSSHAVEKLIEKTLTLIRNSLRKDQILLTVSIDENLPHLLVHDQQLQQVLINLLTNARDALNSRHHPPTPKKTLTITAKQLRETEIGWIRITIEDNGTGIEPDVKNRIFDPFFTTKHRTKGTGLGLSISHGIVEKHGGRITVESEVNAFTRFHLDLPVNASPKPSPK